MYRVSHRFILRELRAPIGRCQGSVFGEASLQPGKPGEYCYKERLVARPRPLKAKCRICATAKNAEQIRSKQYFFLLACLAARSHCMDPVFKHVRICLKIATERDFTNGRKDWLKRLTQASNIKVRYRSMISADARWRV